MTLLIWGSVISCNSDDDDELQTAVILPTEMAFTTGLPVVVIDTPGCCPINNKTEWIKDVKLSFYDYSGQCLQTTTSIKGRGNVTWVSYPKKSFSIKLDKKADLADMKAAKRWVLLANWADRTLLRNDVAFEIARHTSLEWTPRGVHVELVLNGIYMGSYYLCEKIQVGKNRLDITEMNEDEEDDFSITGGYLMEIDTYYDEKNKFRSKKYCLPYQFHYPDDDELTPSQFAYMEQYISKMEHKLASDHALHGGEFEEWIDMQSFADWWIVNELCLNKEVGKPKSVYVYKERGMALKAGPVWDFDYATFKLESNIYVANRFPYLRRLFQSPDFQKVASKRWQELRPILYAVFDYIDHKAQQLYLSAEQNIRMWPISNKSNGDENLTYEQAIDRMKQSLKLRMQTIDNFLETTTGNSQY